MLKPIQKKFKGLITISGPTKSGKSELAEYLIKQQDYITYIATSKPRENDTDWMKRIDIHNKRRPNTWKLIEHPLDICNVIECMDSKESILIDSLGGLVEQQLMINEDQWSLFEDKLIKCLTKNDHGIIIVAEEIGWGLVPATPIGHLFRERHSQLYSLLSRKSNKKWLTVNGTAIDLDKIGYSIP